MKSKKVNLIFFLPNFSQGGAGKSILKITNNLNNDLFKITIISIGNCFYKKEFNKNISIIELNKKKTFYAFFDIIKILSNFNKANTLFISNINYTNSLSCIFIKLILNYKLILIERTPLKELETFYDFKDFFKKKITYFLMKIFYRYADLVIVNSKYTKNLFDKKIKCKIKLIYSPSIDKIKINDSNQKYNKIKLISIGRLSKEKRFNFLIDAISNIKNNNLQSYIVGNGPQKNDLKQLIKEKKLYKKVMIKPYNKKYYRYLKWSNLYVSTSDFEGFPNTIVEAINNNKFILSRDSGGGIHDLIINKSIGKIIHKDTPKNLAKEIENFFYKKKKIKSKKKIIKKFSNFLTKNVSKEYTKIFLNI